VTDAAGEFEPCSDVDYSTVEIGNHDPVSDPGGPYQASAGSCISLDATGSFDPDPGDTITYAWDLDGDGEFDDCYGANCEFCVGPDIGEVYDICLKVEDSFGEYDIDCTTVEVVPNQPPIADAGSDQTVEQTSYEGAEVMLDGSGSTDDGQLEPLSYFWISAIGNATGVSPTMTFPLGTTTVMLVVFDGQFYDSDTVDIQIVDTTSPEVACVETANPHGNNVPGGKNEDGFFELVAIDICDPDPDIFVVDTGSGVVFGPFASGTKIKYTEAPGGKPSIKEMGSDNGQAGAIDWHIKGKGDAAVYAVDASGNMAYMMCYVPPPPK